VEELEELFLDDPQAEEPGDASEKGKKLATG